MCLAAIAIDQDRRFPLVIAANRDEFWDRPTQRLSWWSPDAGAPDILGGRDLESGGTWLGITAAGRLALLTNVRAPDRHDPNAPSRGSIVPLWLRGDVEMDRMWMRIALAGYNGFNLIAADFSRGECFWANNQGDLPRRLERGLFGVSNASLDTPWPKVESLKTRVRDALEAAPDADGLAARLFDALSDDHVAPDEHLPSTGIPKDRESALSAAFIRMPEQRYGTRSSTLVITERANKRLVTHVYERTFTGGSGLALLRRAALRDWPPRYLHAQAGTPAPQADVADSGMPAHGESRPAPKRRQRTLLAPSTPRRPAPATTG